MGQWSNLTANFLSRSCRLILLVLAISTAVPFTVGINTAYAQTDTTPPTVTFDALTVPPVIGVRQNAHFTFSERITNFSQSDISVTGARKGSVTGSGTRFQLPFTPTGGIFTVTIAAHSVTDRAGNTGPVNAVTLTGSLTPPPRIALAGPDTGASDRDRITGQRGILITLASNFDRDGGDTWGISVDGGADNYARTRVDNNAAAPNLRFGLDDGVYENDQVRVRQTVNGEISVFAGLAAFTFDSTAPIINLNGGDITLTAGQTYTELATVSDALDTSVMLRVGGDPLDINTPGTYDLTYDAIDHAGNNAVQLTRTVTVELDSDATLSALTISVGTLSPGFASITEDYTARVRNNVGSVTVSLTKSQTAATTDVSVDTGHSSGTTASTVIALVVGANIIEVEVTASNGTDTKTYRVTVTRNQNPIANAGPDATKVVGTEVILNGSGSRDPDGNNNDLSYAWKHVGSSPPAVRIVLANIARPTFTPVTAGTYTFSLTVTDNDGDSRTDDGVTITATPNQPPVAAAGDDDTAVTNAPVTLDGSGSSDPNSNVGDTLSYAWTHTLTDGAMPATAITLTSADTDSPTFTPTAAGAYTFTLTVTDSVGASRTDTVVITVEPPGISDLDGESGVSLDDAKFLYYAHALGSELDNPDVQTRVLGPLNTKAEAGDLLRLLTAARGSLSVDLNNDEKTTAAEVAMLYYSFALEGSLGDGDTIRGFPEIKRAILGPLAGTDDMEAIDTMLQRVYELRLRGQ